MLITVLTSLTQEVKRHPRLQFAQQSPLGSVDGTRLTRLTLLNAQDFYFMMRILRNMHMPATVSKGDELGNVYHLRIDAEGQLWEHTTHHEDIRIPVSTLIDLADKPGELNALIAAHKKAISHPSWSHQEEYRKRLLVQQLLSR